MGSFIQLLKQSINILFYFNYRKEKKSKSIFFIELDKKKEMSTTERMNKIFASQRLKEFFKDDNEDDDDDSSSKNSIENNIINHN